MSELIGNELKKWCAKVSKNKWDEYEITVINIILKNYVDLINVGGTAGGKRAKKFAEYVNKKNGVCDKQLESLSGGEKREFKKIKRLKSLSVDSFRGFAVSRNFDLNKQYVLLYGPNGSGKSSFSEALEYSLLDTIQEADANRIKLGNYIKNTSTNKGKKPIVNCIFEDGTEDQALTDYEAYRFAFIEKNRITDFSHISVLNSKKQSERISALFGLSEFNEFVQEFTTNFDEKYLPVKSSMEESFKERKTIRETKEIQKNTFAEELKEIQNSCKKKIEEIGKSDISEIDAALEYLHNQESGILTLKIAERDKNYKKLLSMEEIDNLKVIIKEIQDKILKLTEYRNSLSDKAMQMNYKALFETIAKLQETNICPACGTSLKNTVRNPYSYAKEQLKSFSDLEEVRRKIDECAKDIKLEIQEAIDFFEKNKQLIKLLNIEINDAIALDVDEIKKMSEKTQKWKSLCENITEIDKTLAAEEIDKYNREAQENNETYDMQVKRLSELNEQLITLKTQIKEKERQIEILDREIKEFDDQCAETLKKINEEKKLCSFNEKMIEAYKKVIGNISAYNDELPKQISKDLEEKIIDYYNTVNQYDADFEKIDKITLPEGKEDKLILEFRDGKTAEALQVLSEGHVKILGLSILLAKVTHDKLNFIVFDDIVNAIDDDHRNGIADLLMKHKDFRDVQMILSTHGEQFILKLKDKLEEENRKNNAVIYKFVPADTLEERGVIVGYSDAGTPLDMAEQKYNENNTKDAASKCRQAMESITYNLWNKISKKAGGMISVAMRSPKSKPDLNSIVEGLIKKTSSIGGMEKINSELNFLKRESNWSILNKGTHYEDEQKEIERSDVKEIIDHLKALDNEVRNVKIQSEAVCK